MCAKSLHHVWLFVTLWTVACQTPLSMGFFRQEDLHGCHALLQRMLLTQGSNPGLLVSCISRQTLYLYCHLKNSDQFSSVAQLWLTFCERMNLSTPGLPVHHKLLEFAQTHVHQVGDTIQPPHPLSFPSPPAFNLPQHQFLF